MNQSLKIFLKRLKNLLQIMEVKIFHQSLGIFLKVSFLRSLKNLIQISLKACLQSLKVLVQTNLKVRLQSPKILIQTSLKIFLQSLKNLIQISLKACLRSLRVLVQISWKAVFQIRGKVIQIRLVCLQRLKLFLQSLRIFDHMKLNRTSPRKLHSELEKSHAQNQIQSVTEMCLLLEA